MRSSRWSSPARSARNGLALGALLFAVYAATLGAHAQTGSRLTGAEAHVLLTTHSIVGDGDLDLRDEYADRAWLAFHGRTLEPTARADASGRVLEPQGIGLPLLMAPGYAVAGATGARLLLAALAALAFVLAAALARRVVPDPWATGAAVAIGLSPPVVAAATSVRPEIPAAALIAGAAVLALRLRDHPRAAPAFWAALLLALVPWVALTAVAPAAVVAGAMWRWLRRRRRGLAGFAALEVVITSVVVFVTVNERLYGGLTPYAAAPRGGPATGLGSVGDLTERLPRLLALPLEALRWAPILALVVLGAFLLVRAHRERLAAVVADHVHVEVAAAFAALVLLAQLGEAALLAPHDSGAWFPTRLLVPALPLAAGIAGWGLRRFRRTGLALGALTIGLTGWMLVASLAGDGVLHPPGGFGGA